MCSFLIFSTAVDLLRSVGLRNNNLLTSDAVPTVGPTNALDALILQTDFSAPIGGADWNLIGANLPSEFGIFTIFNSLRYRGLIFSINTSNSTFTPLRISLENSTTSPELNSLVISLPGLTPLSIDVPTATPDSPFQRIGIRLKNSLLVVSLNCTVVGFITLTQAPDPLQVANATLMVFESQAIVSSDC